MARSSDPPQPSRMGEPSPFDSPSSQHSDAAPSSGASPRRGKITRILSIADGLERAEALNRLLPIVYDELRAIATARLRGERAGHTLDTTALVHEAYLRLGGGDAPAWRSRAHFFHAAGEAMRRILIEYARSRKTVKRGGERVRVELDENHVAGWPDPDELLAIDEAVGRLEEEDERAADVVRLRYFAGLEVAETAQALGVSERTVMREWAYAKAWLRDALGEAGG